MIDYYPTNFQNFDVENFDQHNYDFEFFGSQK